VVPKKSILEKMGLIDPVNKNNEDDVEETVTEEAYDEIPEPDFVPDLTQLENSQPDIYTEAPVDTQDIPKDIGDKLDLIIGAYEKNKLLTIEEIYRNAHLENEVKKTIFMADVYQKAIPENLPLDIKRETVLNIMNVSSISLEELLNDAYKRIDALNTVLEETVATTQEIFNRNDATVRELEKRIEDLKDINKNRKKFQEDQNTMIEYEIQKIINLVEFVKPKK
jgi:vacuolar-type H+-ATPase subunit I/STV1